MMPRLANKTLEAINSALEKDQGASYRGWLAKVIPHIGDAYSTKNEPFRNHMGASLIGKECGREVWLGWRWFKKATFEGRMVRLFNRGHLEEARFIALLLMIGVQVYQQDANGKQFTISEYGGHFGGSGDGVGICIPDLDPNTPALLEFKTHSKDSFTKLQANGVKEAKPEHYAQMQSYMNKMKLSVAIYGAVNKNNDELYFEIVTLDNAVAVFFIERAGKIIDMRTAPEKLNPSPGFWKCKQCNFHGVCHLNHGIERNCRTCIYSEPDKENGSWQCTRDFPKQTLSKEQQYEACGEYRQIQL